MSDAYTGADAYTRAMAHAAEAEDLLRRLDNEPTPEEMRSKAGTRVDKEFADDVAESQHRTLLLAGVQVGLANFYLACHKTPTTALPERDVGRAHDGP